MILIRNKYKSRCRNCGVLIESKYKVKEDKKTYHMNCYRSWLITAIESYTERLKRLKKFANLLKRHHKELIIEALEKGNR